jgi:hypothetical protein
MAYLLLLEYLSMISLEGKQRKDAADQIVINAYNAYSISNEAFEAFLQKEYQNLSTEEFFLYLSAEIDLSYEETDLRIRQAKQDFLHYLKFKIQEERRKKGEPAYASLATRAEQLTPVTSADIDLSKTPDEMISEYRNMFKELMTASKVSEPYLKKVIAGHSKEVRMTRLLFLACSILLYFLAPFHFSFILSLDS